MLRFRLSSLAAFIGTFIVSHAAFAAAFQLYELGTPIIGTAAVGQAAVAEDASTAYFNPASMGVLKKSQFMLGSQLLLPYVNFSKRARTTTILGDNGGNAGTLTPGMDLYYVYQYTPRLKFGVSLTSPYGGSLNYEDGWVGRYAVQNVFFYTLNLNPSVAYQINHWVALGAGIALEYMNLQETVALPLPKSITSVLPATKFIDGQANVKVENLAPGFNLGVMLTPSKNTKFGIAYRSRIIHNLHGNTTFLRIGATPSTSTKMVMPQNVILSLAQALSQRFTFLGEFGWSNWASMQNTILHVQNFSAVTPLNWNNTWRIGLGAQFNYNPALLFQAGASYDSSPTHSSLRLPDLPMDRQIRIGAGVIYSVLPAVQLGFSYEYLNFGNANINNTSADGVLSGSYSRNYINAIQVSANIAV